MTQQDLDKIKEIGNNHHTKPRPQAWARLSEGLGHKQTKIKLSFYQKLSIAAAFIAVLSVSTLFNHYYSDHHNPQLFASNEQYKPLILEELEETTSKTIHKISMDPLEFQNLPSRFSTY